jgi:putative endonuclease
MGSAMVNERQRFGQAREQMAADFLERNGYRILERNYRTRVGEIDIIARHKGVLVFIEVKARRSGSYGPPKRAVTPAKQRKISMAALLYLKNNGGTDQRARFDVVSILDGTQRPKIEVIRNAFELAYG